MMEEMSSVVEKFVKIKDLEPGDVVRFVVDSDVLIVGQGERCASIKTGTQYPLYDLRGGDITLVPKGTKFIVS